MVAFKNKIRKNELSRKVIRHFRLFLLLILGEERYESIRFKKAVGYSPNFKNPMTLNEKIAWLKIHYFKDYFRLACDKYLIREFLKKTIGHDYAPYLIYVTKNPKDLNFKNITEFPCIIKTSNGSGSNIIVSSKDQYSEVFLQKHFISEIKKSNLHAKLTLEHQYVTKDPYIVVERLLHDNNGGIPNDYKFLCINGNIEFIYCSVDRLGANVRQIYDIDWNRLHFIWVAGADEQTFNLYEKSEAIPVPQNFEKMKSIAKEISKLFPLVRVDFYDAKEGLFIGEITLHHGAGHDAFFPDYFDEYYGKKLKLPIKNRK